MLTLLAALALAQPPLPPTEVQVSAWDIYKAGTGPDYVLYGKATFTGRPSTVYNVALVACPDPQPGPLTYVVVKKIVVQTDGAGRGTVSDGELKGGAPAATQGWVCRLLIGDWDSGPDPVYINE